MIYSGYNNYLLFDELDYKSLAIDNPKEYLEIRKWIKKQQEDDLQLCKMLDNMEDEFERLDNLIFSRYFEGIFTRKELKKIRNTNYFNIVYKNPTKNTNEVVENQTSRLYYSDYI